MSELERNQPVSRVESLLMSTPTSILQEQESSSCTRLLLALNDVPLTLPPLSPPPRLMQSGVCGCEKGYTEVMTTHGFLDYCTRTPGVDGNKKADVKTNSGRLKPGPSQAKDLFSEWTLRPVGPGTEMEIIRTSRPACLGFFLPLNGPLQFQNHWAGGGIHSRSVFLQGSSLYAV